MDPIVAFYTLPSQVNGGEEQRKNGTGRVLMRVFLAVVLWTLFLGNVEVLMSYRTTNGPSKKNKANKK